MPVNESPPMKHPAALSLSIGLSFVFSATVLHAYNPLVMDQFTADPSARVFEGRVYVYPSHDIRATPGKGRPGWFCMEDYHVFSSDNLMDWKDHGVIVSQESAGWVDPASYSMWAPDCVYKNGRYHFFFPAKIREGDFRIGVALADRPEGPFKPEPAPLAGVHGIDPCVFLDRDGQAYLFFSKRKIFVAPLKDSLLELASAPVEIGNLPEKGLLEGPFVFERNGIYYLTYPHVEKDIERLEYAIASHPLGPYRQAGVILDEAASGCWTVHHSIVEYNGQWYLFYHDMDLSPDFDKNRSMRADRLHFEADGSIRKVVPTLRGVGVAPAESRLQIDRHSGTSGPEVALSFVEPSKTSQGWKTTLPARGSWVRFNEVDFGAGGQKAARMRAGSPVHAVLEIRLDGVEGTLLGRIPLSGGEGWQEVVAPLADTAGGVHDLFIVHTGGDKVDVDWLCFE